jgi:hypothetical protein
MKDDLEYLAVEIQRPRGDFPGRVAEAQFVVEGDHVLLYDLTGHRLEAAPIPIPPSWTAKETAARALRKREMVRNTDFNRKLIYSRNYY